MFWQSHVFFTGRSQLGRGYQQPLHQNALASRIISTPAAWTVTYLLRKSPKYGHNTIWLYLGYHAMLNQGNILSNPLSNERFQDQLHRKIHSDFTNNFSSSGKYKNLTSRKLEVKGDNRTRSSRMDYSFWLIICLQKPWAKVTRKKLGEQLPWFTINQGLSGLL